MLEAGSRDDLNLDNALLQCALLWLLRPVSRSISNGASPPGGQLPIIPGNQVPGNQVLYQVTRYHLVSRGISNGASPPGVSNGMVWYGMVWYGMVW